jgi:hypothetical protein
MIYMVFPLLIPDVFLFRLIWGLMDESLIRWMVLLRAAGPAAALTAAPVCSSKQDDVTFVMPVAKLPKKAGQLNWPKMRAKSGEHAFPYVALALLAAIRGMAGTS